jgi:hypothetical protein
MRIDRTSVALAAGGLLLACHPLVLGGVVPWRDVPALADGQDPLLQTAILQQVLRVFPWTLERWNAPFAWPGAYSLAYMDPLVGQAVLSSWMPFTRTFPALAYNVSLVVTLGLAAAFTGLLASSLGAGRIAAGLAAVAYVASPYAAGHLQHLNQLPTPWLPLALWGILQLTRGRTRGAVALGGALVFQTISGVYYTVVVALVVACVLLAVAPRLPRRGWWGVAAAGVTFAVALWIWSLPYRAAADSVEGFTRTAAQGGPFAARVFDFWHVAPARWLPWPPVAEGRPALYPSLVWLALAGVGWWRGASSDREGRAMLLGLLGASALATLLAFGRTMPVPGWDQEPTLPWAWLQDHVWPLRAIRATSRLFLPVTLVIALCGARPLAAVQQRHRWWGVALLALAVVDLAPGPLRSVRVQPTPAERGLIEHLKARPDSTVWAMLPMPGREMDESPADARAMLWAVLCGQPFAGGSTGFVPARLQALREACQGRGCLASLAAAGVREVVVARDAPLVPPGPPEARMGAWTVYALNPPAPAN